MPIKKLLLGSAASLAAVSTLPMEQEASAQPVDYVRVCDAFGVGYHYIPGTQTCLKWSGHVRAEVEYNDPDPQIGFTAGGGSSTGQGQLVFSGTFLDTGDGTPAPTNTATNTTIFNINSQNIFSENEQDSMLITSNFELVGTFVSQSEIGQIMGQFEIHGSNGGTVNVGDAWIGVGENIIAGRKMSRFDFGDGYDDDFYPSLYDGEELNQFTIVMPLGRGASLSLGVEDSRDRKAHLLQTNGTGQQYTIAQYDVSGITPTTTITTLFTVGLYIDPLLTSMYPNPKDGAPFTLSLPFTFTRQMPRASHGGMRMPDFVASLQISQDWGKAHFSSAVHPVRSIANIPDFGNAFFGIAPDGATDQAYGYAFQAGVEFKLGEDTLVKGVGGFAKAAMQYVGGGGFADAAINVGTGKIEKKYEGYFGLGAISHNFSDDVNFALTGSSYRFEEQAEVWQIGASVRYQAAPKLFYHLGGQFTDVDYSSLLESAYGKIDDNNLKMKLRIELCF